MIKGQFKPNQICMFFSPKLHKPRFEHINNFLSIVSTSPPKEVCSELTWQRYLHPVTLSFAHHELLVMCRWRAMLSNTSGWCSSIEKPNQTKETGKYCNISFVSLSWTTVSSFNLDTPRVPAQSSVGLRAYRCEAETLTTEPLCCHLKILSS